MMNLIGLLFPPLIDLVNRKVVNSDLRFWVSVAICVVIGAILQWASGGGNAEAYFQSIMAMFGLAQISYKAVYQNSGMQNKIRSL